MSRRAPKKRRREEASPVLVQTEFEFAVELDGGPELEEEEPEEVADREAAAEKTGPKIAQDRFLLGGPVSGHPG